MITIVVSKRSRAKLVPQLTRPSENPGLEVLEEASLQSKQEENPPLTELDNEIECGAMTLWSLTPALTL